jgi:hypothetical protein
MAENTEQTEVSQVEQVSSVKADLIEALEQFAEKYVDIPTHAKMSAEVRRYLEMMDEANAFVCDSPSSFITKGAEREANSRNRTVKDAKRLAEVILFGDVWEQKLARKNRQLRDLIAKTVRNLETLASMLVGGNPFLAAYSDIFAERIEQVANGLKTALTAVYHGACWSVFEAVSKNASRSLNQAREIMESAGMRVPNEILEAAKQRAAVGVKKAA